jgi:hypothetical protein
VIGLGAVLLLLGYLVGLAVFYVFGVVVLVAGLVLELFDLTDRTGWWR